MYLDKHMKMAHNNVDGVTEKKEVNESENKKKSCPYCEYHTSIKGNLDIHIDLVHTTNEDVFEPSQSQQPSFTEPKRPEEQFFCPSCDFQTTIKQEFNNHRTSCEQWKNVPMPLTN